MVAVSGGVDSTVLLHLLIQKYKSDSQAVRQSKSQRVKTTDGLINYRLSDLMSYNFVIAHLDHGIREDSVEDAVFVKKLAGMYGLDFVGGSIRLGSDISEEEARTHRYAFLRQVMKDTEADAIITAHHQDDVIETAIINTLRGTGRKGLSSLQSTADIIRPLLHVPKRDILAYAKKHNLAWNEDTTNQDTKYLRNRVRAQVSQNLTARKRQQLLARLRSMTKLNSDIDIQIANFLQIIRENDTVERKYIVELPHALAREMLAGWLRIYELSFDKKMLERLVIATKTAQPGSKIEISKGWYLRVAKHQISLISPK